ncbi:DUF29 domain-containing protein [Aphanothece sacrum]|uniref:DUF29 domain-containing protein n=1 Tax=Aphanothece sacrum FPU1 TaxID=1920663 RepID=A0A401IDE8_APHSA|nr:DUF29 domain-containing protein [Aphanothece sacrum]GBF79254.1 hypothetical protein AsFPU1_0647 [Aphanothece sacrum FPU1]GBF86755.1 hypothetical protein AsFPU3_3828 [Aphanothece sacrum FPU3]
MIEQVTISKSLYETDYPLWLEKQAIALKNRDINNLDWINLLEEIEYLGNEQIHAVNNLLKQIIIHRLKLDYSPEIYSRHHWKCEINAFIDNLEDKLTKSMINKIDLEKPYKRARRTILENYNLDLPQDCPYSLDELTTYLDIK